MYLFLVQWSRDMHRWKPGHDMWTSLKKISLLFQSMKSKLLFFSFSLIFLSWIALENLTLNQRVLHVYCYYNDSFDVTLGEKKLFKLLKVIKYHLFNDQIKYRNQLDLFTFYFRSLNNLPLVKSNFIRRFVNNYFAPKWNS